MKSQHTHLSADINENHQTSAANSVRPALHGHFVSHSASPQPPLIGLADHEWKWIASQANRHDPLSQSNTVEE